MGVESLPLTINGQQEENHNSSPHLSEEMMPAALKAFVCVPELQNTVTPETSGADSQHDHNTESGGSDQYPAHSVPQRGEGRREGKDGGGGIKERQYCGDFLLHFLIAKETCAMHVSSWRKSAERL